jgi:hypothetical protein
LLALPLLLLLLAAAAPLLLLLGLLLVTLLGAPVRHCAHTSSIWCTALWLGRICLLSTVLGSRMSTASFSGASSN